MSNVVKNLILTGLMVMLGLWNNPVWAAQVYAINNSTHDVEIGYGAYCHPSGTPIAPDDPQKYGSFTVQAGKTVTEDRYEWWTCDLDMFLDVYIGNEKKCGHDRGEGEVQRMNYYFVRVTLEDAGDGLKCDFKFR